jgi:hypothetical protein
LREINVVSDDFYNENSKKEEKEEHSSTRLNRSYARGEKQDSRYSKKKLEYEWSTAGVPVEYESSFFPLVKHASISNKKDLSNKEFR